MNTMPLYYEDTYRFAEQAIVESLGTDDKGHYIVLAFAFGFSCANPRKSELSTNL
jgi:hypothetical protein